jgi:hypothetical protein
LEAAFRWGSLAQHAALALPAKPGFRIDRCGLRRRRSHVRTSSLRLP